MLRRWYLCAVLGCLLFEAVASTQTGGRYCHCTSDVQSYGCTPLRLEIAPPDRTPFGSVLDTPRGPEIVATGEPLPRLVVRAVANASGVPVRNVDGSSFIASIAIIGTGVQPDAASQRTATFRDGFAVIDNVVLRGADDETAVVNVSTNVGIWLATGPVRLYNKVARPSAANTLVSLAFVADGSSYFDTPALTGVAPIVLGTTLPPVIIRITDPSGGAVTFLDGQQATVRAEYTTVVDANITLRGGAETIRGSDATFSGLSLDNDTVVGTPLRFVFEVGGNSLVTGAIEATGKATNNYRLNFAASRYSSLSPESTEMHAAVGVPMAPIAVQLQDSALQDDFSSTGGFVVVTCATVGIREEGSRARITGGRAVFDNLVVLWRRGSDRRGHILNFTSDAAADRVPLLSPPVYVWDGADATVARRLRFRETDSFVTRAGTTKLVQSGVTMPAVAVEAVDAANRRAFGSSGLAISASADVGQALSGTSTVASDQGLATFADLTLLLVAGTESVKLTFSAPNVAGITTGAFVVTSARQGAADMEFEEIPAAMVRFPGQPAFATVGVPSPPVVLRVTDTAGNLDTLAGDITVSAKAADGTEIASAVTTAGRAVFPSLVFSGQASMRVHFTASALDASAGVHGKQLESGIITVESSVVSLYAARFHDAGHVRYPGHRPVVAVGAQLPRIGVYLVDSAAVAAPSVPTGLRVAVAGDGVTVAGDPVEVEFGTDGVAWMNLTLGATPPPQSPRLCFTVVRGSASADVRVVALNKTICSGVMPVVVSQRAFALALGTPPVPSNLSDAVVAKPLSRFTSFPTGFQPNTRFVVAVEALGASEATVLPTSELQTPVTISGDLPLVDASDTAFEYVSQPSPVTTQQAVFPPFSVAQSPFVLGYFSTLWITSAMPSLASTPLAIGPIKNALGDRDDTFPVVVAEVSETARAFSWPRWRSHMLSVLNIEAGRVRLVRVRAGGTAVQDREYDWRGTRVEFQFLPPTTAHKNKASAADLAEVFLNLRDRCVGLRLRRAFMKRNETTCDLYRLAEQSAAARRCITVSPPSDRCNCYVPMFTKLGSQCAATSHLKTICAQLSTCPNDELQESCSEFRNQLYIQYLQIFGIAVGTTAVLVVVYAYFNGFFERRRRAKLSASKEGEMSLKQPITEPGFDDML